MSKPMQLRYHQRTFELLREIPIVSKTNVRLIEEWEKQHKVTLPGAIREWYSLKGVEKRGAFGLDGYSSAKSIEPMLKHQTELHRRCAVDLSKQFEVRDIGFHHEDISVVARFDATDDPPIFERVEDRETYPSFGKRLRFAEFVFRTIWYALIGTAEQFNKPTCEASGWRVISPIELDYIIESLTELFRERRYRGKRVMKNPFTGKIIKLFPYRFAFQHPSGFIAIRCQANPAKQSAESCWVVLGHSESDLFELAKLFWACGDFSKTLTAANETGKAVLTRLRRHYGNDH